MALLQGRRDRGITLQADFDLGSISKLAPQPVRLPLEPFGALLSLCKGTSRSLSVCFRSFELLGHGRDLLLRVHVLLDAVQGRLFDLCELLCNFVLLRRNGEQPPVA